MPYSSEAARAAFQAWRKDVRTEAKGNIQGVGWDVNVRMFDRRWSPQLIEGTLHRMLPDNPGLRISYETACNAVYVQCREDPPCRLVAPLGRSLTYDQSRVSARRADLAQQTGMKIYFCGLHSPW